MWIIVVWILTPSGWVERYRGDDEADATWMWNASLLEYPGRYWEWRWCATPYLAALGA